MSASHPPKNQFCGESPQWSEIGCPRNNQIFFRIKPKQTETQSVLVVFWFVSQNQKTFFSVCFGVSDRYRNNRNKQNFLETNRKNLHKTFSIRGSSKPLIFQLSSNRNLICFGCFPVCFFAKPKNLFFGLSRFVSMFRTGIETKTNRTYGMGN